MRVIIVLVLLFEASVSFGQKKQVCFTYDDLPLVNYGITDSTYQKQVMDKLIVSLITNHIPAIGFVNEKKMLDKRGNIIPVQLQILSNWAEAGFELGNHTFSHLDYNEVRFSEFCQDIIKGERLSKKLLVQYDKKVSYFRHPFLHEGNSKSRADSLNRFIEDFGYKVAPVTIDNEDYLFAVAYKRAKEKNNAFLVHKIGKDYIEYMENKLKYYERQSMTLFERDISQILLLHANELNADFSNSLAEMYRNNGYEFVSMDEALKDEAYKSKIAYYSNYGISWLDKWMLTRFKKGGFFKDEPTTPEYIVELSN